MNPDVRPRAHHGPRAMTLVEVLVVSIVLSVVLGVAISVPAAGRRRAQDAHAQASALAAVDAVQVLWERDGAVTDTPDVLADINGRLRWTGPSTPSGDPIEVSVAVDGDVVGIATASASGRCWIVRHTTDGIARGIRYGRYDLDRWDHLIVESVDMAHTAPEGRVIVDAFGELE